MWDKVSIRTMLLGLMILLLSSEWAIRKAFKLL
jgi:hypothetical protein